MTPEQLRHALQHLRLSQAEFARLTEYSEAHVCRMLNGSRRIEPRAVILISLIAYLGPAKYRSVVGFPAVPHTLPRVAP